MEIVMARRISQVFFFLLFLWFCVVSTFGIEWWQLRGWPVSWFLQLDPLVAIGTVLTTRTLYSGLAWAVLTLILTILLGRFFCGWVCPFGAIHHFVGYLAHRRRSPSDRAGLNRYKPWQSVKYGILLFMLGTAAGDWMARPPWMGSRQVGMWASVLVVMAGLVFLAIEGMAEGENREESGGGRASVKSIRGPTVFALVWVACGWLFSWHSLVGASLQTGLLDPIPLVYRSINMFLLPVVDSNTHTLSVVQRFADGGGFIAAVFVGAVLLNLVVPRFYCRFICPLGALLGVVGRNALWRIGKNRRRCVRCGLCESQCEGACEPAEKIRWSECLLCMNCTDLCRSGLMVYSTERSRAGEEAVPDISRRAVLVSFVSGLAAVPVARLGGTLEANWPFAMVRPPGSLAEPEFLARCIKCGQCMRVCPTNVVHPAGLEAGVEGLWTPILNFRAGTSGCQYNCVACGYVCPTAAIRPIRLDEKHGKGPHESSGPVRMGLAFVDRGRCLPWAMDKPCLVCQENCPVSPKAIYTREHFAPVRNGALKVKGVGDRGRIELEGAAFKPGAVSTGDYFLHVAGAPENVRHPIVENLLTSLQLEVPSGEGRVVEAGAVVEVLIRLKQPYVDPERCIGCGICQHECPVAGLRAIRVTAENESRNPKRRLLLR